jgi:hypothetical protein
MSTSSSPAGPSLRLDNSFIVNLSPQQAAASRHQAAISQTRSHYLALFASHPRDTVALVRVNFLKYEGKLFVPERYLSEIITPRESDNWTETYRYHATNPAHATEVVRDHIDGYLPRQTSTPGVSSSARFPGRHQKVMTIPVVPTGVSSTKFVSPPQPLLKSNRPTRRPMRSSSVSVAGPSSARPCCRYTVPPNDDPQGRLPRTLVPCWYHENYKEKAYCCQPPCRYAPRAVNDAAVIYVKATGQIPPTYRGEWREDGATTYPGPPDVPKQ